jgi:hypothetical protein
VDRRVDVEDIAVAQQIGLAMDADPVIQRKARQVFFRDMRFTDETLERHILPGRATNAYQFGLARRQLQDLQGGLL